MALPKNLSQDQLHRFIGGRRHYNSWRKMVAIDRRYHLLHVWAKHPHWRKADLARHFGVSRATITRDVQWLRSKDPRYPKCPLCLGAGRVDNGPATIDIIHLLSDLKLKFPHLHKEQKQWQL